MYNCIILIGRPTRDPELLYTGEGHAVASFTLAVDRAFKNGQGERPAFDPGGELERLPGLGEGEGLWYCVHGDTPRGCTAAFTPRGAGTILWEA